MKTGVFVNCLKVNAEEGVKVAAELGLSGIQFNAQSANILLGDYAGAQKKSERAVKAI